MKYLVAPLISGVVAFVVIYIILTVSHDEPVKTHTIVKTVTVPGPTVTVTPNITVCHSKTQTHCLWVDGHAEWH